MHINQIRSRRDKRGFDLISAALPFGRLWYTEVSDAIDYATFRSRRVYRPDTGTSSRARLSPLGSRPTAEISPRSLMEETPRT
jgi:hypothetical protein